jgi:hypothetical protein
MNLVHTVLSYFPKIHSNIIFYLCPGLSSGLFPSGFPTRILYAFLIYSMHATCPAQLIHLDLITLIILDKVNNVKMNLKGIGHKGVDWIQVATHTD